MGDHATAVARALTDGALAERLRWLTDNPRALHPHERAALIREAARRLEERSK